MKYTSDRSKHFLPDNERLDVVLGELKGVPAIHTILHEAFRHGGKFLADIFSDVWRPHDGR